MTEEEFIEDKLRNALQYDPSMSLFDKHKSQTIEQCAPHARTRARACECSHTAPQESSIYGEEIRVFCAVHGLCNRRARPALLPWREGPHVVHRCAAPRHLPCNMQRGTCEMQHGACNVPLAMCDMQHATCTAVLLGPCVDERRCTGVRPSLRCIEQREGNGQRTTGERARACTFWFVRVHARITCVCARVLVRVHIDDLATDYGRAANSRNALS